MSEARLTKKLGQWFALAKCVKNTGGRVTFLVKLQVIDLKLVWTWAGLLLATAASNYLFVQKFPFKIHRSNFVFGVDSTPFLCAENCFNFCEIISPNKTSASFLSLEDAGCAFAAKAFPILCKTNNSACWTVSIFFLSCYCLNLFYHRILWYKLG